MKFPLTPVLIAAAFAAQAAAAQTTAPPAFDVASIRQNNSATDGRHHIYSDPRDSHFRTVNVSLNDLLQFAYALPETQIVGGPPWLDTVMFDIDAKSGPEVDAIMHDHPSDEGKLRKQLMLQALLADRFQLKTHQETRQLPVYSLVVADRKAGPKFKPSEAGGTTIDLSRYRLHVQGSDNTLTLLARELALTLGRVVVDNTGVTGRYDLILRWMPDDGPPPMLNGAPDTSYPSIFTAVQEQLGLKLESTKAPVTVLVVDHIDMPSDN